MFKPPHFARRGLLQGLSALLLGALIGFPRQSWAQASANPTPACEGDDDPTPAQTEGPYFTPSSPERSNLTDGSGGTPITLDGSVFTRNCRPISGALVELWHADHDGEYDNEGHRYRGHVFTGQDGRYRFETIVPGLYPGRTRHFHVKYQAPSQPVLTTQLYFPDEPTNARDRIFRPELLLKIKDGAPLQASFDAVLDVTY